MELASRTALITGGASGIGLALAERFLRAGAAVIVCGRRAEKLHEAQAKHPGRPLAVDDRQVMEAVLGHHGHGRLDRRVG